MRQFHVIHVSRCPMRLRPKKMVRYPLGNAQLDVLGEYQRKGRSRVPVGLRIVVTSWADSQEEAEHRAYDHTVTYLGLACAVTGTPFEFPRLVGILEEIDKAGRYRYHHRFYDLYPVGPTREVLINDLSLLVARLRDIGGQNQNHLTRLNTGLRWYTMGFGERDQFMRFLSFWIALETLAPVLSEIVHPHGVRAACTVCGHPAGVKREQGIAGMQHALAATTGDRKLADTLRTFVRHNLFHGLIDLEALAPQVASHWADLEQSTARALLEILSKREDETMLDINEPLYAGDWPHAVWDCTIIGVSEAHREHILYDHPFSARLVKQRIRRNRAGALDLSSKGTSVNRPADLQYADEKFRFVQQPGTEMTVVPSSPPKPQDAAATIPAP